MVSVNDVNNLVKARDRALEHEKKIDKHLREYALLGARGIAAYSVEDDREVAEYLKSTYEKGGWEVTIKTHDPDRAYAPAVTFTLTMIAPKTKCPTDTDGDGDCPRHPKGCP
jgi:hypothetical protein